MIPLYGGWCLLGVEVWPRVVLLLPYLGYSPHSQEPKNAFPFRYLIYQFLNGVKAEVDYLKRKTVRSDGQYQIFRSTLQKHCESLLFNLSLQCQCTFPL